MFLLCLDPIKTACGKCGCKYKYNRGDVLEPDVGRGSREYDWNNAGNSKYWRWRRRRRKRGIGTDGTDGTDRINRTDGTDGTDRINRTDGTGGSHGNVWRSGSIYGFGHQDVERQCIL